MKNWRILESIYVPIEDTKMDWNTLYCPKKYANTTEFRFRMAKWSKMASVMINRRHFVRVVEVV